MQIQSARYLGELTVAQEQAVRRIIYDGSVINNICHDLKKLQVNRRGLSFEYEVIVYLTIYYNYVKEKSLKENCSQLRLQEIMLQEFGYNEKELLERITHYLGTRDYVTSRLTELGETRNWIKKLEKKYPNFAPINGYMIGIIEAAYNGMISPETISLEVLKLYEKLIVDRDAQLNELFYRCDMSSYALKDLIKEIRGYIND